MDQSPEDQVSHTVEFCFVVNVAAEDTDGFEAGQ